MDCIKVVNNLGILVVVSLNIGCCQLVQEFTDRPQNPLIGDWVYRDLKAGSMILSFYNDLTYHVDFNADGQEDIWGKYEYRNQKLRMDFEDALYVTDCYTPGFYKVKMSKGELDFQLIADQCKPRQSALSIVRVRKQK